MAGAGAINPEAQCHSRFMKLCVGQIPNSASVAQQSFLPLGALLRPLAPDDEGKDSIEVVNFGACGIIRCKRCRSFINPFVQWLDDGRRWRCNLCGLANDVPSQYFCHLDANNQRRDKDQRPELSCGSVELVAPAEYMVRPPQAPVYVFVIDVSVAAVQSGMLQTCVDTIKAQLDALPGSPRTQVGFVTFDKTVHFYNLNKDLNQPQMMVVNPLGDLFLPVPDDLLVNLSESREVVDTLLESLPAMFASTQCADCAFGPALQAAFKVVHHIGGKMCAFLNSLPSVGGGKLKQRDNPRALGTDKEHLLLAAEEQFYKAKAVEFSKYHVSCELFLFSNAGTYLDVATLSGLAKHTGGQVYYYPGYSAVHHGQKFGAELTRALTRPTGFESVMRVRCTRGMRITNFYGNYFIRGTDLLALPNCTSDSTFGVELAYDDTVLAASVISVQAALLYTTSSGERRIRVHTVAAPVTTAFQNMFLSADIDSVCNLMAKISLQTALTSGFDAARESLYRRCVDVMRSYRSVASQGMGYQQQQAQQGQLMLPEQLQLLPLYAMALQKNMAFRGGTDMRTDERAFLISQLSNMSVEESRVFIYPRLFEVHNMNPQVRSGRASKRRASEPASQRASLRALPASLSRRLTLLLPLPTAPPPPPCAPPQCGLPAAADADLEEITTAGSSKIVLPDVTNLTYEHLKSDAVFLLEDSQALYMWVGKDAPAAFLNSAFSLGSLEGIDCSQVMLLRNPDELSQRINGIVDALREDRPTFMQLHVCREGDGGNEARFFWHLVEDRASFTGGTYSYAEFLQHVTRQSHGVAGTR